MFKANKPFTYITINTPEKVGKNALGLEKVRVKIFQIAKENIENG